MKTPDYHVIIFEGDTFAIFSNSHKPIEKKWINILSII